MPYGGTVEVLNPPLNHENEYGGTDVITHRAWGMQLDPFMPMETVMVSVTMYHGKPVGGKEFKMYPGLPPQTVYLTPADLKALNQAGKYSLQGIVGLAKEKLGVT